MLEPVSIPLTARHGWRARGERMLWIMVAIPVIHMLIFKYIPMYGVTIAFQNFSIGKGYFGSDWVGFKHFQRFLTDPFAFRVVRNTVVLSLLTLLFAFPVPIVFAIALNEVRRPIFKRSIQTISYLPHFVSVVITIGLVRLFFGVNGSVNDVIAALGLPREQFLLHPGWFRFLYIVSDVWQSAGWGTIVYLAALTAINPELYEAAHVDGATRFQRIRHITFPGLLPTAMIILILSVGRLLDVRVERVLLLYNPATYEVADVIATYLFRRGLLDRQYSYAAAVGLGQNVFNLVLLLAVHRIAKTVTEESLW